MKEKIIVRKVHVAMKPFTLSFFNHFSLNLNRKKCVVMRPMRKKLNIFTLQVLEKKSCVEILIGANADIAKIKREKWIVFVVVRCNAYCFG